MLQAAALLFSGNRGSSAEEWSSVKTNVVPEHLKGTPEAELIKRQKLDNSQPLQFAAQSGASTREDAGPSCARDASPTADVRETSAEGDANIREPWMPEFAAAIKLPRLFEMVTKDQTTYSMCFDEAQCSALESEIMELQPGCKKERPVQVHKASDSKVHKFGEVPLGALSGAGRHPRATYLPPITWTLTYVCKHVLVHKHPERPPPAKTKKTHVLPGCDCPFSVSLRGFDHGDKKYVLVTVTESSWLHRCPQSKAHRAPLTPRMVRTLMRWLLDEKTPEDVFKNRIVPLNNSVNPLEETFSRLATMTQAEITKFAKKRALHKKIKPGEEDFKELHRVLDELRHDGARVALKLPGQTVDSCASLDDSAKQFFKEKDFFLFVQTEVQAALLSQFGTCIGTDGTHATVSYNNVKLITVHVSSFGVKDVQERGFPVAFILTTSERTDIHKAIVAHIRAGAMPGWEPKLLMSDMAFGAYNAWVECFPNLRWLWCAFHVWQAWERRIRRCPRPDGITQDEFTQVKDQLLQGFKFLICPPDYRLTWEEFDERAARLSRLLWGKRLCQLARSFDEDYVKRKSMWAPPARREVVKIALGSDELLPMLARSNNVVERFHGVVKHVLLKGTCALTFVVLLQNWIQYQGRIRINAIRCGLCLRELILAHQSRVGAAVSSNDVQLLSESPANDDEQEEADYSDDDVEDVDEDDDEDDDADGDEKNAGICDQVLASGASSKAETPRERTIDVAAAQHARLDSQIRKRMGELEQAFQNIRVSDSNSLESKKTFHKMLAQTAEAAHVYVTAEQTTIDVGELGTVVVRKFIKQADNWGTSAAVTADIVEASAAELYKQSKPRKATRSSENAPAESFDCYLDRVFAAEGFEAAVQEAKAGASSTNLPSLRSWLSKNNQPRIRAFGKSLLDLNLPASNLKDRNIDAIICAVEGRLGLRDFADGALIGDVAVVTSPCAELYPQDLVCLKVNAMDNLGDPCVEKCENLVGWVVRGSKLVEVEVELARIKWGCLSEKRKDVSDLIQSR